MPANSRWDLIRRLRVKQGRQIFDFFSNTVYCFLTKRYCFTSKNYYCTQYKEFCESTVLSYSRHPR